jgi:membrane protein implicated in regulation of membrane protease activity
MSRNKGEIPQPGRWPAGKIALVLYPLAAGAAAVNVFFLGLIVHAIGVPNFSPWISVVAGLILGVPFAWVAGRYFRRLIDEAES